ncbi:hypothetical protein PO883_15085 [Massilia sp. DJPM01]|uniref:hypothetical protein n=1 Tax=Massilia sp. DJPM01 TaxID=3024404 RepID=UPI00259EE135|nr:hypothetical protein [Massilia sp. DJPM01]MDM5178521.1 hypothetical protein [Massilia sp. DJPM01]
MASMIFGKANLVAGVEQQLGSAVPANETAVANVSLVNRGSVPVRIRLAFGTGIAAADADWIAYDRILLPNCEYEKTGCLLTEGEKIFVRSDTATVSARAHALLEGA